MLSARFAPGALDAEKKDFVLVLQKLPVRKAPRTERQVTAGWCAKRCGQDEPELLWEPRAESSPPSWERSPTVREASLQELTPELCPGGLYLHSSIFVLAEG